jgi:hypothetical protein
MRSIAVLTAAGLLFASVVLAQPLAVVPPTLAPAARVTHGPLDEMSGIVKSRRYPNTYWVHNDSGDAPRIFAIRGDGGAIMPPFLSGAFSVGEMAETGKTLYPGLAIDGAAHSDWEDIAVDGDTLYIADLGNNGNARRDLAVYVLPEPNPAAVNRAHVLKRVPVAYPDQRAFPDPARWHFDCEAVFVFRGRLHMLTKHRAPGQIGTPETGTNLYRLDTQHTDRVNVLTRLDSARDLGGWVTAADVSPDGRTLAVLCHAPVASVWLFDLSRGAGDRPLSSGRARRLILPNAQQCEAVCFDDNDTLFVTNEQRDLFRLRVSEFAPAAVAR